MFSIAQILTPLGEEKYKIVTSQSTLNQLIQDTILSEAQPLKWLKLIVFRKSMHIRGVVTKPFFEKLSLLNAGQLYFDIKLIKQEIHRDEVYFKIKNFKVYNPAKKMDIYSWLNRYSKFIKHRIIEGITSEKTPFREIEDGKILSFDLKFVLSQIPTEVNLLGNVSILNLGFEAKKIVWYIRSNVVLKSIIDYLGPGFLSVEKLNIDVDVQKLLTDSDFSDE